jgi:membrane fusion protein, multidrug efflux system
MSGIGTCGARQRGARRPAKLLRHFSVICLIALGVACQGAGEAPSPEARPPVPVETFEVSPKAFARTVETVGSLRSPQSVEVTAELAGVLTFIDIPEGARVKKGHVLARLDASAPAAELAVARARLQGTQDVVERTRNLEEAQLLGRHSVDDAVVAHQVARTEVARQSVTVEKMVLRAPFDGVVGIRQASVGAYVTPGTPITTLTSTDALELIASVPERHVSRLQVAQVVRGVVGACAHRFTAEVSVLEPAVDPDTRTLGLLARVREPMAGLRPGMSASVKVEVEQVEGALLIPLEALIRRGTRRLVYVVKDGVTEPRTVRTGDVDSRYVEIVEGLSPGEKVITAGHQKVGPGREVSESPFQPVDNPNLALGILDGEADCWF